MTARNLRGERGAITMWTVVLILPMLVVIGLAFDGGAILAERRAATHLARTAAIAGAQAIDPDALREGTVVVDPGLARVAIDQELQLHGVTGTAVIGADEITVSVTSTIDLELLTLIGRDTATVTGTSTIRITRGITEADQ